MVLRRNLDEVFLDDRYSDERETIVSGSIRRRWPRTRDAVVSLAGPLADYRHTGRFGHVGARFDFKDVRKLVGKSDDRLAPIYAAADELVAEHWPAIRAVARKLVVVRRLSGREVRKMMAMG